MAWEQHSHADGETFTADDMNRMEEAIYDGGGYSSKKEWADQNVPGVENWNRLENGILAIGSDKVSQNLLLDTQEMSGDWAAISNVAFLVIDGEDEFKVMESVCDNSSNRLAIIATDQQADDSWANKTFTFSFEIKADATISLSTYFVPCVRLLGRNNSSQAWTGQEYSTFSVSGQANPDTWTKIAVSITIPAIADMTGSYTTQYADKRYGVGVRTRVLSDTTKFYFRKFKLETAGTASNWSPAVEDIFTAKTWESEQDENNIINADNANRWEQGITDMLDYREKYATDETETATPQSIPDDTEDDGNVAAPEAEEIE